MTLRISILSIFSLVFLTYSRTEELVANVGEVNFNCSKKFSFYGTWTYSFPFYSSELTINEDSSFKFHERGCMGHGYTEGKWTFNGVVLEFTSYDKYKEMTPPISVECKSEPSTKARQSNRKKAGTNKLYFNPKVSDYSVYYKFPDTLNRYFQKVLFKLNGDTLCKLKAGIPTDAKFTFSKNNR